MARPRSDVFVRFKSKVKEVPSGCHEWQSTIKKDGYGSFHFDGRQEQAHRVAYKLFVGEIPEGSVVLHACDNRKCVNLQHLTLGSTVDNIADMDLKSRRGTKSKLTYSQVEEIKKMIAERHSQTYVAELFGVHQGTVSRIILGKTTLFKA